MCKTSHFIFSAIISTVMLCSYLFSGLSPNINTAKSFASDIKYLKTSNETPEYSITDTDGYAYFDNVANPVSKFPIDSIGVQTILFGGLHWRMVQYCDKDAKSYGLDSGVLDPTCTSDNKNTVTLLLDPRDKLNDSVNNLATRNYEDGFNIYDPQAGSLNNSFLQSFSPVEQSIIKSYSTKSEQWTYPQAHEGYKTEDIDLSNKIYLPSTTEMSGNSIFGIGGGDYDKYLTRVVGQVICKKMIHAPISNSAPMCVEEDVEYNTVNSDDPISSYIVTSATPVLKLDATNLYYLHHDENEIKIGKQDSAVGQMPEISTPNAKSVADKVDVNFGYSVHVTLSTPAPPGTIVSARWYDKNDKPLGSILHNICNDINCKISSTQVDYNLNQDHYSFKLFLESISSDNHIDLVSLTNDWKTVFVNVKSSTAPAPTFSVDYKNETIDGFKIDNYGYAIKGKLKFINTCDDPYKPVNSKFDIPSDWKNYRDIQFAKCNITNSLKDGPEMSLFTTKTNFTYPKPPSENNGFYTKGAYYNDEYDKIVVQKGYEYYELKNNICDNTVANGIYHGGDKAHELAPNKSSVYCVRKQAIQQPQGTGQSGRFHSWAKSIVLQKGVEKRVESMVVTATNYDNNQGINQFIISSQTTNRTIMMPTFHFNDQIFNFQTYRSSNMLLSFRNNGNQPIKKISISSDFLGIKSLSDNYNVDIDNNFNIDKQNSSCIDDGRSSSWKCDIVLLKPLDYGDELVQVLKIQSKNNKPEFYNNGINFSINDVKHPELDSKIELTILPPSNNIRHPSAPDNKSIKTRLNINDDNTSVVVAWDKPDNFGQISSGNQDSLKTYNVKITNIKDNFGSAIGSCDGKQQNITASNTTITCTGLHPNGRYTVSVRAVNHEFDNTNDWVNVASTDFVIKNPNAWDGPTVNLESQMINQGADIQTVTFGSAEYYLIGYKQCYDSTSQVYRQNGLDTPCDSAMLLKKNLGNGNSGESAAVPFSSGTTNYASSILKSKILEIYNNHINDRFMGNSAMLGDVAYDLTGVPGYDGFGHDDKMWALSTAQASSLLQSARINNKPIFGKSEFDLKGSIYGHSNYGINGHGFFNYYVDTGCIVIHEEADCWKKVDTTMRNSFGWWLRSANGNNVDIVHSTKDKIDSVDPTTFTANMDGKIPRGLAGVIADLEDAISDDDIDEEYCEHITNYGFGARPATIIHISTYQSVQTPPSSNPAPTPTLTQDPINETIIGFDPNGQYIFSDNNPYSASSPYIEMLPYTTQSPAISSADLFRINGEKDKPKVLRQKTPGTWETDNSQQENLTLFGKRNTPVKTSVNTNGDYDISNANANEFSTIVNISDSTQWSYATVIDKQPACLRANKWYSSDQVPPVGDNTMQSFCIRKTATNNNFASDAVLINTIDSGKLGLTIPFSHTAIVNSYNISSALLSNNTLSVQPIRHSILHIKK